MKTSLKLTKSAVAPPSTTPAVFSGQRRTQVGRHWQMALGLALILGLLSGSFAPNGGAFAADTEYRVFYYNARERLLFIEQVDKTTADARGLDPVGLDNFRPPEIRTPIPKNECGTDGDSQRVTRASFAVYYAVDNLDPGNDAPRDNVQARAVAWEDLAGKLPRDITCAAKEADNACSWPPNRCHCVTGTCCCY